MMALRLKMVDIGGPRLGKPGAFAEIRVRRHALALSLLLRNDLSRIMSNMSIGMTQNE